MADSSPMTDLAALPDTLPVKPTPEQLMQLDKYLELLMRWNNSLNLVGHSSRDEILRDLVLDSFYLADFLAGIFPAGSQPHLVDLGAGAGLPGIPLRILWQAGFYDLIEARQKRALFLSNVLAALGLPRVNVFRGRAETFLGALQKPPAAIISRAFMPWPKLLRFCAPFLGPDSLMIILASGAPEKIVDWHCLKSLPYTINSRTRWLWCLKKDD